MEIFYGGEILCSQLFFLKGSSVQKDPGAKETEHWLCGVCLFGFGIFPLQKYPTVVSELVQAL
jgi:hypothetical protein